jgi:hypothetical protein
MNFRVPELTGEPCHCDECRIAGVADKPVVRSPDGELHGRALARWYRERERAIEALARFRVKPMPMALIPKDDDGAR